MTKLKIASYCHFLSDIFVIFMRKCLNFMTKTLSKHNDTWLKYLDKLKGKTGEHERLQWTGFDDFFHANGFAYSFFST